MRRQNIALLWIYERNFKLIAFHPCLTLSEECFVQTRCAPEERRSQLPQHRMGST